MQDGVSHCREEQVLKDEAREMFSHQAEGVSPSAIHNWTLFLLCMSKVLKGTRTGPWLPQAHSRADSPIKGSGFIPLGVLIYP